MKHFYLILTSLFFFLLTASSQTQTPTSKEVLATAYNKAKKENKNVMVIFHASWCGWCRKMEASLLDDNVAPLINKNYVIVYLDVYEDKTKKYLENPGALDTLTKYGGNDKGMPYWFVFDKNSRLLNNSELKPEGNIGCPASEKEVAQFISILKNTSSLKAGELKIIEARFRKNEQ